MSGCVLLSLQAEAPALNSVPFAQGSEAAQEPGLDEDHSSEEERQTSSRHVERGPGALSWPPGNKEPSSSEEEDSDVYEDCAEEEEEEAWLTCSEDEESRAPVGSVGQSRTDSPESPRAAGPPQGLPLRNSSHLVQKEELLEILRTVHSGRKVREGEVTVGLVSCGGPTWSRAACPSSGAAGRSLCARPAPVPAASSLPLPRWATPTSGRVRPSTPSWARRRSLCRPRRVTPSTSRYCLADRLWRVWLLLLLPGREGQG